ncbi:hypothetical protein KTQ74_23865 [Pseudomonas chlororaphis]|uniref:hypothetical protein n=1 Tax=Pseudomonas chlororaphis TaxID=587753 RepID=UPI001E350A85|nr:hypothetical protein [Pseudomonas chlororaphis]MCB2254962.1 hypothetical protein [Pseudomonas chlororaphis]
MPEHNPPADDVPIKLFPEYISLWADGVELATLAIPARRPSRVARYAWLMLVLGLLAAVALGQQVLALVLGALLVSIPLLVLGVMRLLDPPACVDAWFDADGLHLTCGPPKNPGALYRHFLPFADITRLATLDQTIDLGRRGRVQYRTCILQARQFLGDNTSLNISNRRSLAELQAVLERLRQLPAAAHIGIPPTRQYGA